VPRLGLVSGGVCGFWFQWGNLVDVRYLSESDFSVKVEENPGSTSVKEYPFVVQTTVATEGVDLALLDCVCLG
jgi:hypothetical protein